MSEVLLTGYGMINALGETPDAWWAGLNDPKAAAAHIDSDVLKPFHVHRIGEYDLASQVPKRMVAPLSVTSFCVSSRQITGCGVSGSNSMLLARSSPQTFRANSIVAICIPRHRPK